MIRTGPVTFLVSVALLGGIAACGSAVDASDSPSGGEGAAASIDAGAGPAQAGSTHTVIDRTGFGGPALDVGVPPGWRAESAVRWDNQNGQCSYGMASPVFRMTSADGRSDVEVFPGFLVTTSEQDIRRRGSQPGDFCIVAMADSGEALAERIAVPFLRPQARIQGMRQVALHPMVARIAQNAQQLHNPSMRLFPYTVETLVAHPDGTMKRSRWAAWSRSDSRCSRACRRSCSIRTSSPTRCARHRRRRVRWLVGRGRSPLRYRAGSQLVRRTTRLAVLRRRHAGRGSRTGGEQP